MISEVHGLARAGKHGDTGFQQVLVIDAPDCIVLSKEWINNARLSANQARFLASQLIAAAKRLEQKTKK